MVARVARVETGSIALYVASFLEATGAGQSIDVRLGFEAVTQTTRFSRR